MLLPLLTLLMLLTLLFLLLALLFFLFRSVINGAPFVPTSDLGVERMLSLADVSAGDKAADLGSGDGRIVIALAKKGSEAHGYEINPFLVLWSRYRIVREGLTSKAFAHWKNFWQEDLSSFDVVTIFGITYIMKGLEEKLKKELKKGARVVCNSYPFPNWKPGKREGGVFLYRV